MALSQFRGRAESSPSDGKLQSVFLRCKSKRAANCLFQISKAAYRLLHCLLSCLANRAEMSMLAPF